MRLIQRLVGVALTGCICVSGGAYAGLLTDDEEWTEGEVVFPPEPKASDLSQFYVGATTPNAYFVDLATLSVGQDRVVRYVLVIRSPRGAENVTFEGIRCATAERRLYAIGQSDGKWVASKNVAWEPISLKSFNSPQAALAKEYFCDGTAAPVVDADEARKRLKRGTARGFNPALDETGRM